MSALGPWTYEPGFGWTRRSERGALGAWVNSVNRWAVWLANGPSDGGPASTAEEGKEKADAYIAASAKGAAS